MCQSHHWEKEIITKKRRKIITEKDKNVNRKILKEIKYNINWFKKKCKRKIIKDKNDKRKIITDKNSNQNIKTKKCQINTHSTEWYTVKEIDNIQMIRNLFNFSIIIFVITFILKIFPVSFFLSSLLFL